MKPDKPDAPRKKLTVELVSAGLRKFRGNVAAVAMEQGLTRQSVHEFINRRPKLLEIKREAQDAMLDHAESALHRAIIGEEPWAIRFFLKTQGRRRGYIERQEVTGDEGGPILYAHLSEAQLDQEIARLQAKVGGTVGGEGTPAAADPPEADGRSVPDSPGGPQAARPVAATALAFEP